MVLMVFKYFHRSYGRSMIFDFRISVNDFRWTYGRSFQLTFSNRILKTCFLSCCIEHSCKSMHLRYSFHLLTKRARRRFTLTYLSQFRICFFLPELLRRLPKKTRSQTELLSIRAYLHYSFGFCVPEPWRPRIFWVKHVRRTCWFFFFLRGPGSSWMPKIADLMQWT